MGSLYKYRACGKYTEQIFKTGCLHYSYRTDFNDPYDSMVCIDKAREIYQEGAALTLDKQIKKLIIIFDNDSLEQIYQDVLGKFEILCLSRNGRQLQMWSHYADNHKGLCLEFDDDILRQSLGDLFDVKYNQEPYKVQLNRPDEMNEDIFKGVLCTKEKGWEYEQEVRLLRHTEKGQITNNYPFNKQALKSIYFGSQCTQRNIIKYKRLCRLNGFEHVKFYQMEIANKGKFELVAKEI